MRYQKIEQIWFLIELNIKISVIMTHLACESGVRLFFMYLRQLLKLYNFHIVLTEIKPQRFASFKYSYYLCIVIKKIIKVQQLKIK